MNLFQLGDFVLASKEKSYFKIYCDALSDKDIETLAYMIQRMVGRFSSVEGIPRGGLRLAEALKPYYVCASGPHLIVDDVLTTGSSMQIRRQSYCCGLPVANYPPGDNRKKVIGAVIFARGLCPTWIKSLFQMPSDFLVREE